MNRGKELEDAVAKLLILKGYKFWRIDNYICYKCRTVQNSRAVGMPDYVVWYPFVFFVECKTGSGKLSAGQKFVADKSPVPFIVVKDTIDALIKFVDKFDMHKNFNVE